jgi:hypothetical protein
MAICTPLSECKVCRKPLGSDYADFFGFSAVGDVLSEFGDFIDACAHKSCLKTWEKRGAFVAYYNASLAEFNIFSHQLQVAEDGNIEIVELNAT